ncbi:BQ2448_4498 [Microbotryum intermedium]|uniref:NADH dehydrogenase [ubiquinone] 1 alpha subcomplex subunit n=1 Tax=Microbotryum intermedium TaxID=269621 RepID=A0A238FIV2_9BASI|nr:BQ2448_4498 [Microbotryum intermedium]
MILTPSIKRVVANIRQVGLAQAWRDLQYIGDFKAGQFVGQDEHGNKYYENKDETLWRHRWVDFASHDFNASQITPEWHSWISHIRHLPPPQDPVVQASKQPWQTVSEYLYRSRSTFKILTRTYSPSTQPHWENLTGTRGAFKTYSTTKPKIEAWEPTTAKRS